MANWISHDKDSRKHGERGKLSLRTQKLFGIIKDVYRKIDQSHPPTVFPTHETMKALKDYQTQFEQRKSETLAYLHRSETFSL